MEWREDIIDRLKSLWTEGLATAEIGRRLGISKNAVVGKAHRLGLASRPSPIRRGNAYEAQRRVPRRVRGPTLPPLPSPTVAVVPPPTSEPARRPMELARSPRRLSACCWPIGEPGTAGFRFCNAEALAGKPYCAEHAQIAYVRIRDRREDAA